MVQDLDAAYGVTHEGPFYVTGVYTYDADGAPAIETGDLAISHEAGIALAVEYESDIRYAERTQNFTLRRFRLVDEGPVLDALPSTES